ncbi:MAG TPA: two-component system response regulator [Microbacterium sp.]|nr:two-component system response regulator [Microbacterium sp.]
MIDAGSPLRTAVIVEDDPDVRDLLAEVLGAAGFSTVTAENGVDGVRAVLEHQPLITTLDVNMPGIDGFEAARRIRAGSDTYIIMLTALDEEADVVLGLTSGADEYLNKPFRPRELRARIDALLRRPRMGAAKVSGPPTVGETPLSPTPPATAPPVTEPQVTEPQVAEPAPVWPLPSPGSPSPMLTESAPPTDDWLSHRDLQLNRDTRIVLTAGGELELTRTEFDLLCALMQSKRRVCSKPELALVLRGESYVADDFVSEADKRTVEAHMTNLRRKLGDSAAQPRYIETVRGVGYRLTAES